MTKWLWQWKWAFVIAIIAGPAFAYFNYNDANRIERIMANGSSFEAIVTGGSERRGRRGARTYMLDVEWTANGAPHRESFEISSQYAEQIFTADYVNLDTVELRHLASEPENATIVVPDAPQQLANHRQFQWLGIGAGIAGLIISPIWFWAEARFRRRRDDDIDAELARMRQGEQQG